MTNMTKMSALRFTCCASFMLLALTGCPTPNPCATGEEDGCQPDASLPPDFCNSKEEAVSDTANCQLTVNVGGAQVRKTDVFISTIADGGRDTDWYVAQMPTLTPRSLLHVNAGYSVPQTGVNFALSILKETSGSLMAIKAGLNKPGTAAPKPVDIIIPFSESNAKLFILANDEGQGTQVRVDNRNSYSVFVEVVENPDVNEPNDTVATAIPLMPMGMEQRGTQTGFLATNDDVDLFSFDVASATRQILYLAIKEIGTHPTNPPPDYLMSYVLTDPMNNPIGSGVMANNTLTFDLSSAHLIPMVGKYKLQVQGFKAPNSMDVVKGDLRVKYEVEIRLLPDIDSLEPNDSIAAPKVVSLAPNGSQSLTGRISYITDEEWFSISLPARASPSTLRYKWSVSMPAGRFPPLSKTPNRQLRAVKKVTQGTTLQDQKVACLNNSTVCPKGFDGNTNTAAQLVEDLCNNFNPPQCVLTQRAETVQFTNLKNFVGALPIEANQTSELFLQVRDEGLGKSKYADDKEWTLELEWRDDADEAARMGPPISTPLNAMPTFSTGNLSFGYGRILPPFDINSGTGIRAFDDYDAVPSDTDLFEYSFAGAMGDLTWQIEWQLGHPDGGTAPPGDIAMEFSVCDLGGPDGGLCQGERKRIFAYSPEPFAPWYVANQNLANSQQLFIRTPAPNVTTFQVKPVACQCFAKNRVAAQKFFMNVGAINRVSNEPIVYRLRQSVVAYPTPFTSADGGSGTCPSGPDAGCRFTEMN
jgi:hypothetical protein